MATALHTVLRRGRCPIAERTWLNTHSDQHMYPTPPIEAVRKFAHADGASVGETPTAVDFQMARDNVIVTLTVPRDVLEWFVDVADGTGPVASDWCDYEGYDDTPRDLLLKEMAADIEQFLARITSRPIRIVREPGARPRLEWLHEGAWHGAVPFSFA